MGVNRKFDFRWTGSFAGTYVMSFQVEISCLGGTFFWGVGFVPFWELCPGTTARRTPTLTNFTLIFLVNNLKFISSLYPLKNDQKELYICQITPCNKRVKNTFFFFSGNGYKVIILHLWLFPNVYILNITHKLL